MRLSSFLAPSPPSVRSPAVQAVYLSERAVPPRRLASAAAGRFGSSGAAGARSFRLLRWPSGSIPAAARASARRFRLAKWPDESGRATEMRGVFGYVLGIRLPWMLAP